MCWLSCKIVTRNSCSRPSYSVQRARLCLTSPTSYTVGPLFCSLLRLSQYVVPQVKTFASTSASSTQPEVTQLALSPDEKQLAAGHADGTLRLWDFEAAESEHPASGHRSGVSALCYSQNGALLASGGQDTEIVVWDVTSGTPLYRLQGHLGQVTALVSRAGTHQV